jgi:hypothetical protein
MDGVLPFHTVTRKLSVSLENFRAASDTVIGKSLKQLNEAIGPNEIITI